MKMKQMLSLVLVTILVLGCFAGCGASSVQGEAAGDSEWYNGVYDKVQEQSSEVSGTANEGNTSAAQNQKLIRTMEIEAETDDLDALLGALDSRISALNGYVENRVVRNGGSSSTRRYRYADLTIRIPAQSLDAFVEHIEGASNVVYHQESADDVTLSYVATQSRITALETEQTRLLELLAKAESMNDLLLIEERLTDVRTELEEVTSRLRLYDNLVNYGTVNLSVTEVQEFTVVDEETVWQRISTGFVDSVQGLWDGITEVFVFVVVYSPYLLVWAAVILVAVFIIRRSAKKRRKSDPPAPTQDP